MAGLGGIGFVAPWLLLGLAALPLLWWLLRVTPPAPSRVVFPAIRLLGGLRPREDTPARAPFWLLLLRLFLAAALIIGIAHPVVDAPASWSGGGPLLIVLDDGWAAAKSWQARQDYLADLVGRADHDGRPVMVLPTAAEQAMDAPSLMRPAEARAALTRLQPHPWMTDRRGAARRLHAAALSADPVIYWLSDGLSDGGEGVLAARLRQLGRVHLVLPEPAALPQILLPGDTSGPALNLRALQAAPGPSTVSVTASDGEGATLARSNAHFGSGASEAAVALALPLELRNRIAMLTIDGQTTAAATLLLDAGSRRQAVGIATDGGAGTGEPLLSRTYYLNRALQPFASVDDAPIADLVRRNPGAIILPDGDPGGETNVEALRGWIDNGGVFLRFAGPLMAENAGDGMLPVMLRRGGRSIGGVMSWEKPAHLAPFPAMSPFAGLPIPADVTVSQQVLAEPSTDLAGRTWARLSDGTPLVTAEQRGRGWVVLVHTSANSDWSNLAMSGLFVDMLKRIAELGQGGVAPREGIVPPWRVLDGFGRLTSPAAALHAVAAAQLRNGESPGPGRPPGYYGSADSHFAFNLGPSITNLAPLADLPDGLVRTGYDRQHETDLRPLVLGLALLAMLADLFISFGMRGLFGRRAALTALLTIALGIGLPGGTARAAAAANAQDSDAFAIAATQELHLAYIVTGDAATDAVSRAGLEGLRAVLSARTAVDTGVPVGVDPDRNDLIFFPLIYWPLTPAQSPLSPTAVERINRYLDTGGVILLDTRDQGTGSGVASDAAQRLRGLLAGVHVPPLAPIPPDHVLTRSFYLLQDFPGRWLGGTVWVQPQSDRTNDGVSKIIIGANDWAAAWAVDGSGTPEFAVVPGGEQQREMALRFGVNLVMYALTGNYKLDQVHVPAILERLGQ